MPVNDRQQAARCPGAEHAKVALLPNQESRLSHRTSRWQVNPSRARVRNTRQASSLPPGCRTARPCSIHSSRRSLVSAWPLQLLACGHFPLVHVIPSWGLPLHLYRHNHTEGNLSVGTFPSLSCHRHRRRRLFTSQRYNSYDVTLQTPKLQKREDDQVSNAKAHPKHHAILQLKGTANESFSEPGMEKIVFYVASFCI